MASAERGSLSFPFVTWDAASQQYVMIPTSHAARAVQIFTASSQAFPLGFKYFRTALSGDSFHSTVAVQHGGLWWIFTTVDTHVPWTWLTPASKSYGHSLRLFYTDNLVEGSWTEHPRSPMTTDKRFARSGGRPFVQDGRLYRWALDKTAAAGSSQLHLMRIDRLDTQEYWEAYHTTLGPQQGSSWAAARLQHMDWQPAAAQAAAGAKGFGLVAGDTTLGDPGHARHHRHHSRQLKRTVLNLVLLQLLLVGAGYLIWHCSDKLSTLLGLDHVRHWQFLQSPATSPHGTRSSSKSLSLWLEGFVPELLLLSIAALSVIATMLLFTSLPQVFHCPRWNVRVDVIPSPPVKHHDPSAPYNVSDMVVVTGATANFFDRTKNMIGSLHAWEPHQRILVYDLGYAQEQLAEMMCWQNVELVRFPYDAYPAHVSDVTNYAFKALVLLEAMKQHRTVLWIDSGLELREPLDTVRQWLAQYGHVSAMQEDLIGDPMYTLTRIMADYMGLGQHWGEVKGWQFCAGGLQGFVRGSDADRLVLQPVVNCSLAEKECIAPPGASRKNHNFDQTAFTLAIWANNFSCLPRETHCMWSVKKVSRDPLQRSDPIEMVSRGHRLPKPYHDHILKRPDCHPNPGNVPWTAVTHQKESLSRHSLWYRFSHTYLQLLGDVVIQCFACQGVHVVALLLFWALLAAVWCCGGMPLVGHMRRVWSTDRRRMLLHVVGGSLLLLTFELVALVVASNM